MALSYRRIHDRQAQSDKIKMTCRCGTVTYAPAWAANRQIQAEHWTCADCKRAETREINEAMLRTARNKKKIRSKQCSDGATGRHGRLGGT